MQTAELVAGRELDALIAEKVMGMTNVELRLHVQGEDLFGERDGFTEWVPTYSADILAAWQVVEHLRTMGWEVEVKDHNLAFPTRGPWFAVLTRVGEGWGSPIGVGYADTAPLAICRAALAAVGYHVEHFRA